MIETYIKADELEKLRSGPSEILRVMQAKR